MNKNDHFETVNNYGRVNSLSKDTMTAVLKDIENMFPAKECGIIFWSHGTGWLTAGNTRSFGDDGGEAIEICDMAEALVVNYDYLIFDACYMGSIEVATTFKDKCSYFIASPYAIPTDGIIDTTALSFLSKDSPIKKRVTNICEAFSHKTNQKDVPIAAIDEGELDGLIKYAKELNITSSNIISEELFSYNFRGFNIFYDIKSLFSQLGEGALKALNRIIIYPSENQQQNNCGISVFIPQKDNADYWSYYSTLDWNLSTNWLNKWIEYEPNLQ